MALITNNISGSANNGSLIGITGSLIIANVIGEAFPTLPSDVSFYVSGSKGIFQGKSVFGGDVVVSGSLSSQNMSGSLTKLADGSSYLIAGNNIGIISQSNGSIIISSSTPTLVYRPGGVETDNVYSSWSSLMTAFNQLEGIVNIDIDTSITSPATVSVGTYDFESRVILRGTQTGLVFPSRLQMPDGAVIKNPREFENIWLDMLSTSTPNFEFDIDDRAVKFTGLSYIDMNGTQPFADITAPLSNGISFSFRDAILIGNFAAVNRCFLSINNASAGVLINLIDNVLINNDNFIAGTAGSLVIYHDSSVGVGFDFRLPTNPNFAGSTTLIPLDNAILIAYNDLFAGTTELSASTVQTAIDVLKERWSSAIPNALFTTSSIAIKGIEPGIDAASDKGADVFFYVSGSQGSKDGGTPGVALFGGDVVISGTLHGGSPLKIGSGVQITGSLQVTGSLYVTGSTNVGMISEGYNHSVGDTGTVVYNITANSIFYVNNPVGDITANFTNVPTTDYRIITTTVILSQSSTPRIVNAVQIDGVGSTIDWLNGSTPSGTADKQDVFSFNLIRSGSVWKTLGQLSTYG